MVDQVILTNNKLNFLDSLLDSVPDLIFYKDLSGVYLDCNKKYAELNGLEKSDIIGRNDLELYGKEISDIYNLDDSRIISQGIPISFEAWVSYPDGREVFLHTIKTPQYDKEGKMVGILGIARDITEMKNIENKLIEREKFLTAILETAQDGYFVLSLKGRIVDVNKSFCDMSGYSKNELLKMNIKQIDMKFSDIKRRENFKEIMDTGSAIFDTVHRRKDGSEFNVEVSTTKLNAEEDLIICFSRDITERKRVLRETEYLSYFDHLTGLNNRRYLDKELIRLDRKEHLPLTIIAVDVNDLKLINDAFGHQSGDELLKEIAGTLSRSCRDGDILGRTGGDEFAIYLPKTDIQAAEMIKNRILKEAELTRIDPMILSLSVGYAIKIDISQDINDVIKTADNMMYADKVQYSRIRKHSALRAFFSTICERHPCESEHSVGVADLSIALAAAIGTEETKLDSLRDAALMHDIGKIVVPENILCKPEKLTEEEFEIVRQHPVIGYRILKGLEGYSQHAKALLYHHERWDGTGYPMELKGERIPVFSRILAIADAYESMTTGRPYKFIKTREESIEELRDNAGTQFDPKLVEVFIEKVLMK